MKQYNSRGNFWYELVGDEDDTAQADDDKDLKQADDAQRYRDIKSTQDAMK
jgi:hypothetical protein